MSNIVWKSLYIAPILLEVNVMLAQTASASDVVGEVAQENKIAQLLRNTDNSLISEVTSVSQLSDVQPTDWAFQALQSLVERYAYIAGYPNGTFRGNRAMSRFEFAAGLNACLDRVNILKRSPKSVLVLM